MTLAHLPKILVIGPMPPPVHGYSLVTSFVVEELRKIARVEVVDNAPDTLVRRLRYHVERVYFAGCAAWALLRQGGPDRVLYTAIAGGSGVLYDLPLVALARACGFRIFFHHHSYNYVTRRRRLTAALFALAGNATTHICLSADMARRLSDLYVRVQRTFVLSNAMLIAPAAGPSAHAGPIRLGFLSNLIPEKGLDVVLAVARALHTQGVAFVLVVAGPALSAEIRALLERARVELGAALDYRGAVYGTEKTAFFQDIELFLFPTRYTNEAQPLVLLEALAAGVPVVTTDHGSIRETVGESGAVFSDVDYLREAVAMISLWSNDRAGLIQLSAATQRRAEAAHASALGDLSHLVKLIAGSQSERA